MQTLSTLSGLARQGGRSEFVGLGGRFRQLLDVYHLPVRVPVVVPDPGHRERQRIFVTAFGRQVKKVIGLQERI